MLVEAKVALVLGDFVSGLELQPARMAFLSLMVGKGHCRCAYWGF